MTASALPPALRLSGITRSFPGVLALSDVTFEVAAGSCHALCGENGAGKSTVGRIAAGIHAPDAGELQVFGRTARFSGPRAALQAGIGMVHQELAFCDNLTVAENLCLGALPRRGPFLSRAQLRRRARDMLALIEARELDAPNPQRPRAIIRERRIWGGETYPRLGDGVL